MIAAICALTCKDIWASSPVSWPRHESRLQTRADVSSMFICCPEWSSIRVLAGHPIRDERVSRGGQVGRLGSRQEQIVAKQLEPSCNLACTEALGLLTTTRTAKTHILMLSTKCLFPIIYWRGILLYNWLVVITQICQFWYNRIIEACISTPKKYINSPQKSQNWSKWTKIGQNFAFSMLNSTPSWKKYTTAGCDG